ncbi:DUF1819 family protein [Rhodococcus erythropolis]|uniref:DUF1819 family protein n=1 Tax=Rhodococcus erythropolis TaxID=1833 RepID=UPI001BE676D8|nr:DUF1819 family protein [Rhodococcus erythropolis]MBT2268268.1 DUF1819 family protein [Rhodococcus erythropolis]
MTSAYRLSFTTGGLLLAQGVTAARVMLTEPDVSRARALLEADNRVQQRTAASTKRVTHEVVQRVAMLPRSGLELLAGGSVEESRHLMWLAACLRYQFLADFGRDVVRERYAAGAALTIADLDTFWDTQSSWIDALRDAKPSTRVRLRSNTFQMLREAEFLDASGLILGAFLSSSVVGVVSACGFDAFRFFPLNDSQVAAYAARKDTVL